MKEERLIEIRIPVPWISLSRETWKWGMVCLFLFAFVGKTATESMTLTTYYPSPAGVYNNFLSIGNTWLARDPVGGNPSYLELGNQSVVPNGVKLDVESGSVRLTNALGGVSSDHWIGTDNGGANLALYSKAGGNVDIGAGAVANPALSITSVGANQQIEFHSHLSIGSYPTDISPPSNNPYVHINGLSSCQTWGPGANSCHGAGMGADKCQCPAGQYATWIPGIYVETGLSSGWFHARYEWGIWAQNINNVWQYFAAGGNGGVLGTGGSMQVSTQWADQTVFVPGRNYNLVTNQQVNDAYGDQYFYCCPK